MTKEEALPYIERLIKSFKYKNAEFWSPEIKALDVAIEALQAPQAPTDGDSISRQGVINLIRREVFWCDNLIDEINSFPSAGKLTGEWIYVTIDHYWDSNGELQYKKVPVCSNCMRASESEKETMFCSYCGADMRGGDTE